MMKSAPYIIQKIAMTKCMMNPNKDDQQSLVVLANQLKQLEPQKEPLCWYIPATLKPAVCTSFSSSLHSENDKVLDHLNILDKADKILNHKQGGSSSRQKQVEPPSPKPECFVEEPSSLSFILEPIPLGPQGIQSQNVVNEIPLIKSGKFLLENNLKDQEDLFSALSPLLLTKDNRDVSEKQRHHQDDHLAVQNHTFTYHNEGNITKIKLPGSNDTMKAGILFAISSSEDFMMNAYTAVENFCDSTTEAFDLRSHCFKRKFQLIEEVSPSLEFFSPVTMTASSGAPSKKQRNMEYLTFDSFSESMTPSFSSKTLRNPAVVITSDGDRSYIDQIHHQEQKKYQDDDSSSLVLSNQISDFSSCLLGDVAVCNANNTTTTMPYEHRFRSYQCDQWNDRFQDLADFKAQHGHCSVPYNFPSNQHLAQWIKRQRYQYKLKNLDHHSTLTDERQLALEQIGFVWDFHKAVWMEHFESLKQFKATYGNCNVPSNYINHSLAVWVKCQRRQYKLFLKGRKSAMTRERILLLESVGFDWNPRKLKLATA